MFCDCGFLLVSKKAIFCDCGLLIVIGSLCSVIVASALNLPVVYSTDRSKAVALVLGLLCVTLWFNL